MTNFDEVDVTSDDAVLDVFAYLSTLHEASRCKTDSDFVYMKRYIHSMRTFIARVMEQGSLRLVNDPYLMDIITVTLPRYIQSFNMVNVDWEERMRAFFYPHPYIRSSGIVTIKHDSRSGEETGRPEDYGTLDAFYVKSWEEFHYLFPGTDVTDVVQEVADIINAITVMNGQSNIVPYKDSWFAGIPDPENQPDVVVLFRTVRVRVLYNSQRPIVLLGDLNMDAFKPDCVKHLSGYMFTPVVCCEDDSCREDIPDATTRMEFDEEKFEARHL